MSKHIQSVVDLGWMPWFAEPTKMKKVEICGRKPYLAGVLYDAATAANQALIAMGYENPCDFTGGYLARLIAGTDIWSKHSYGIAFDLDYGGNNPESPAHAGIDKNPHIHRPIYRSNPGWGSQWQINQKQVDAVEAIRNTEGDRIWRWLGWSIGDTMHFEAIVGPYSTQVDWATVPGQEEEMDYNEFRAAEFDMWTNENIMEAFDDGMFQSTDRAGFQTYWVTQRSQRSVEEKSRFITDFYAHLRS
jgi:hypothetical protein